MFTLPFLLVALAQTPNSPTEVSAPTEDPNYARGVGLETNVLWPFFPGGISELRLLVPVLNADRRDLRGELVFGTYADFAHRVIRKPEAAKTGVLAAKFGYRQFLWWGLHLELSANVGWRHESQRSDGDTVDALQARGWLLFGYQHEFNPRFYANLRGGLGLHLYRSDRHAAEERTWAGGADLNLGVRF